MNRNKKFGIYVMAWTVVVLILWILAATASTWTGNESMKVDADKLLFPAGIVWILGYGWLCHKIIPLNPPKGATPKKEE